MINLSILIDFIHKIIQIFPYSIYIFSLFQSPLYNDLRGILFFVGAILNELINWGINAIYRKHFEDDPLSTLLDFNDNNNNNNNKSNYNEPVITDIYDAYNKDYCNPFYSSSINERGASDTISQGIAYCLFFYLISKKFELTGMGIFFILFMLFVLFITRYYLECKNGVKIFLGFLIGSLTGILFYFIVKEPYNRHNEYYTVEDNLVCEEVE